LCESYCLPLFIYVVESMDSSRKTSRKLNVYWNTAFRKILLYKPWEPVNGPSCIWGILLLRGGVGGGRGREGEQRRGGTGRFRVRERDLLIYWHDATAYYNLNATVLNLITRAWLSSRSLRPTCLRADIIVLGPIRRSLVNVTEDIISVTYTLIVRLQFNIVFLPAYLFIIANGTLYIHR